MRILAQSRKFPVSTLPAPRFWFGSKLPALPKGHLVAVAPDLRLRLRFTKPRYQLIAKAIYLPEGYRRLRLWFAKPRYQLIAKAIYLAKPRFCSLLHAL